MGDAPSQLTVAGESHGQCWASLTEIELHVLRLIMAGTTNKRIAQSLSLSERTTTRLVRKMFEKLGVTRRTMAVVEAVKRCLF